MATEELKAIQPRVLTILRITPTAAELDENAFNSVLDKVGDRPIAIYSISGETRTGKSYLLNFFIRYFEAQKQQGRNNSFSSSDNWLNFNLDFSFKWRSGKERETMGMNLWSEPYFVRTKEGEVAVLLMDTQGLFDDKTTARQNAIIFSLTALCSSVVIYNVMRHINEDLLQQIQYFSSYAHMMSTKVMTDDPDVAILPTEVMTASTSTFSWDAKFQNLRILVRDFELGGYQHGLHEKTNTNSRNFVRDTFHLDRQPANCPEENTMVRHGILQKFEDVSVYLLPDPGKNFIRGNANPDEDFQEHVKIFIESMVSSKNLVEKKVEGKGKIYTGTEFKKFVNSLSKIVDKSAETFPEVYTLAENTAFMQYTIAKETAFLHYQETMDAFVSQKLNSGFTSNFMKEFKREHTTSLDSAIEMYKRMRKFRHSRFDEDFERSMKQDILQYFDNINERLQLTDTSCGGGFVFLDGESGLDNSNQMIYADGPLSYFNLTKLKAWLATVWNKFTFMLWRTPTNETQEDGIVKSSANTNTAPAHAV